MEGEVMNLFRRQPLGAAAFVLALIALSAALVVPAVAGKKSSKITTKRLANGAVTNPKLANNAVSDSKIADNAVTTGKIANGAVTDAKLGNGAATNAKLGDASVTSSKLAKINTVEQDLPVPAGPNGVAALTVDCPAGTTVISGGGAYVVTTATQDIQIRSSFKSGNGWRVAVVNMGTGAQDYLVDAYCLS
jgi:hypothetical protein